MKRIVVPSLLLLVACSKKSDDKCERMIAKSMKVLTEMATLRGVKLGAEEKQHLVGQCKRAIKAGKPDPQLDCVLAATDDAAVRKCYIKGYEAHVARSKELEAQLQLTTLGDRARTVFTEKAEYPKGKVGPTPATPCCSEPSKQCTSTDAMWSDPVWQALGFRVDGAFLYQYTYESDGKTFTATATGDIGCTGKPTTTTLTGKVGADGAPELSKL